MKRIVFFILILVPILLNAQQSIYDKWDNLLLDHVNSSNRSNIIFKSIDYVQLSTDDRFDEIVTLSKYSDARKVSSFLRTDFDRMGQKSLEEITKKVSFDMNKDPKQLRWDEAEEIVKAFKEINFIAPSSDALRPIGEKRITTSLQNIVDPEFMHVLTRKPQVYAGGFPFQVEVSIAYGGKAGRTISGGSDGPQKRLEIMRFANRSPLIFDAGNCAITKAVHSIDWKRYDIKDIDNAPVTVLVNFISVYIPYTGAGKQAIADEEDVIEEIRLALMQSGRKAGRYISGKRKEAERLMKRELFYKYDDWKNWIWK